MAHSRTTQLEQLRYFYALMNIPECCNKKIKIDKKELLEPTGRYICRYFLIGHCTVCGKRTYNLLEYDLINNSYIIDRNKPKRIKHLDEWLESIDKQKTPYSFGDTKIKYGNKSAMAFIFGKSKETPLGILHQGIDFNGTKRKEFLISL